MKASGEIKAPIRIDDEFFAAIARLHKSYLDATVDQLAKDNNLSHADMVTLSNGLPPEPAVGDPERQAWITKEKIYDRYIEAAALRLSIEYDNGFSYDLEKLEELVDLLAEQSARPVSMSIRAGRWSIPLSFQLSIREKIIWSSSFEFEGPSNHVENLLNQFNSTIEKCRPDYPLLYNPGVPVLIRILVGLSAFVVVIRFVPKSWVNYHNGFFVVIFSLMVAYLVSGYPYRLAMRVFPHCEYSYGIHARRRKSALGIIIWCATAVVVPLFLEILPVPKFGETPASIQAVASTASGNAATSSSADSRK